MEGSMITLCIFLKKLCFHAMDFSINYIIHRKNPQSPTEMLI